ncbi:21475_t:CDS:2, partial [Gigaspora rosea]
MSITGSWSSSDSRLSNQIGFLPLLVAPLTSLSWLQLSLGFISSRIVGPSPFTSHSMLFGLKLTWRSSASPMVWQVKLKRPCKNRISAVSASGPAVILLAVVVASYALVLANFSIGRWSSSSFPFASPA